MFEFHFNRFFRFVCITLLVPLLFSAIGRAAEESVETPADETEAVPADGDQFGDDLSVWPNKACYRSSERWLVENHDTIRKMRPKVLVINFANDAEMDKIREQTEQLTAAFAESTRHHGFKNLDAPAFLEYEVVKYVDMRDRPVPEARAKGNSAFFPTDPNGPRNFACDYQAFYSDAFARFYGFTDPENERHYLNLHELIEKGMVHELWFYAIHEYEKGWPAYEVIELKQRYDENFQAIEGEHTPAGNGHSDTMPWSDRTFRIAFFNPHRGPGCAIENYGHGLEGTARSKAIPYFTRYFNEYAEMNLDKRFNLPFNSLYRMPYGEREVVTYPSKTTINVKYRGNNYIIEPYIAKGGNAHWAPGGRHHYDLSSPYTVSSIIENYRMANGPDGEDKVLDFNKEKFAGYRETAPDCMGAWLVFWRQCMPGLDNQAYDDQGKPMKNWWPFLFY